MSSKKRRRNPRHANNGGASGLTAWWTARPAWQQHALCLGGLFLASLLYFAPVHFSEGTLGGGDLVSWRAQAEAMIEYRQATGEEPLWNPNVFGGMPGYLMNYGEQVPQIDGLPRLLRGVLWPTSHFLFLLFGAYGFVFYLTKNKGAGLLSAVAYGTTTYLVIALGAGHATKFVAFCFAPWMAWAFAWTIRRPRWLSALAFAIALAINLRASHVQITYYLTFLLGVWWVVELVGAARHGRLRPFGWSTAALALGSLLGLLMVAQPYLTYAEYKGYTVRGSEVENGAGAGEEGMGLENAMRWSQGVGELATLAVAGARGGSSRSGTYWGPKPFTEGPHYVGGIVLFLALLAVWKVRRNVVYAFAIGAFLMTLFALGHHFALLNEAMYAYFPLFDAFRAPETWMSMVAFALAILAGLGADYACERVANRQREKEHTRAVYASAGAVAALAALLLVGGGALYDFEKAGEREQRRRRLQAQAARQSDLSMQSPRVQQAIDRRVSQYMEQVKPKRRDKLSSDAWRTLIVVLLAGAALWGYRSRRLGWPLAAGALVVLVGADLGGVARRHLSEDDLSESSDLETQIQTYGADQFIQKKERQAGGKGHFRVLSLAGGSPMTGTAGARASYFHESIGGYHGAKLRRYQNFIDHIYRGGEQPGRLPNENALDLMNTRYIVAPAALAGRMPGTRVVYRDSTRQQPQRGRQQRGRQQRGQLGRAPVVLKNTDAVPRAFFVGQTEVLQSAEATWQRLRSPRFNPRRTALLPEPIENFQTTPLDSVSTASVELKEYTPRRVAWQVQTDAPRLLVASEVYYPAGWNAYLDGEQVPIHRANYLLRAVAIPEGQHRLVMRFEPQSHRVGLWLSGVSTVGVYGAAFLLVGRIAYRRRERWTSAGEEQRDET